STLGASYDPSPQGSFSIRDITPDPSWHFQPDILEKVPDDKPDAMIPPGPNNAVGVVWMALSEPHYGIHGTKSPETIGYATSAGCVRLTNWDALFLARRMPLGTPVRFRETRAAGVNPTGAPLPRARTDTLRADTIRADSVRRDSVAPKPDSAAAKP
ncbi:MAG: L,D-transpeptidase, partial [Gemmatimonadetes bacterium]|nr:L,D-transpeptidase [Gemmatimonadota bacterium]